MVYCLTSVNKYLSVIFNRISRIGFQRLPFENSKDSQCNSVLVRKRSQNLDIIIFVRCISSDVLGRLTFGREDKFTKSVTQTSCKGADGNPNMCKSIIVSNSSNFLGTWYRRPWSVISSSLAQRATPKLPQGCCTCTPTYNLAYSTLVDSIPFCILACGAVK